MVLAKYYSSEENDIYCWYRAIIINSSLSSSNKKTYDVMYLDYGNIDKNMKGSELVELPEIFGIEKYAHALAYQIRLADSIVLSINEHGSLIEKFLLAVDSFRIEIATNQISSSALDVNNNNNENSNYRFFIYDVYIWDKQDINCLNREIQKSKLDF